MSNKYTLTWLVTKRRTADCPDYKPDPYTGAWDPMFHCTVNHFEIVEERMSRTFDSEEEALEFMRKAPKDAPVRGWTVNGEAIEP